MYQTHVSIGDEADPLRAVKKRKKTVTIGGVDGSMEHRRARFYRLLHTYHIHAEEEDLDRHDVIFPPGLLTGEGDMDTFLGEFTALQSSYSSLLSIVASLPHLCLALTPEGYLSSYNQDPTPFFGQTLTALTQLRYSHWFTDSTSGVRGSVAPRNIQLINSISLAYTTRTFIREEHLMFQAKGGKSVPITLTVLPVLYGQTNSSSFDERFLVRPDAPQAQSSVGPTSPHPTSTATSDPTIDGSTGGGIEAEAAARAKERADERAAREAARSMEIARVIVVIENKEVAYRMTQQTRRLKELMKAEDYRRSSSHLHPGLHGDWGDDGSLHSRRRSLQVPQPKLDTSISSALTLMQTLARQEKNAAKRSMYSEIIHMLSHSKGMESVNDDVIIQIEENSDVGNDVKSWLINQINPNSQGVEERLDDKEKEREKEKKDFILSSPLSRSSVLSSHSTDTIPEETDGGEGGEGGGGGDGEGGDGGKPSVTFDSPLQSPGRVQGSSSAKLSVHQQREGSVMSRPTGGSIKGSSLMAQRDSVRPSVAMGMGGGGAEAESAMPRGMSMQNSDSQFSDPSPEISLIPRPIGGPTSGSSNARSTRSSRATESTAVARNGGSVAFPSVKGSGERRKTLKERKSVAGAEKKSSSSSSRASSSASDAPNSGVAGNVQKLLSATTSLTASLTVAAPPFAPLRPTVQLPLQGEPSDKRVSVEKPSDSRVKYSHWSGPLNSVDEGKDNGNSATAASAPSHATEHEEGDAVVENVGNTSTSTALIPSEAVVLKDSIFTVVGCSPPEIHANAALDVNAQSLFWSSTPRPVGPPQVSGHSLLHSPIYLTPSAEAALATSLSHLSVWNQFNIFHVSARSQGWPLTFTFTTIVTQLNLMGKWGLDAVLVSNFIREVERGYFAIPYHSSTHAADVLQHSYHMITQTHLGLSLTDLDMLILLVAAAVHDYGHPGVSNQYLSTTFSPLALQYNDKNVLESYHIASIFLLMQAKVGHTPSQHNTTSHHYHTPHSTPFLGYCF